MTAQPILTPEQIKTFAKAVAAGRENLGWSLTYDFVRDLDDPKGRYYWYNFVWLNRNYGAPCDDERWAKVLAYAGLTPQDLSRSQGLDMAGLI